MKYQKYIIILCYKPSHIIESSRVISPHIEIFLVQYGASIVYPSKSNLV